jgi:hypothetical protein
MSLILAVQPDRKQAAKIVALARTSLRAEIIVTESADETLTALATRVPDLVLISQLLSPKDDAAITERLRELDAGGVQVQTLVIPMLGSSKRRTPSKQLGLLSRLRISRDKAAAPDGCDPEVFATQILEYLERADVERQAQAETAESVPAIESAPVAEIVRDLIADPVSVPDLTRVTAVQPDDFSTEFEDQIDDVPSPLPLPVDEIISEDETEPEYRDMSWEEIDLDDLDDELVMTAETIDLEAFILALEAGDSPSAGAALEAQPKLRPPAEPPAGWSKPSWPRLEGVEVAVAPVPVAPELAADPELAEFVAALEAMSPSDSTTSGLVESKAAAEETPASEELWMPLAIEPHHVWPPMEGATVKAPGSAARTLSQSVPAQDEWGFFDPEQCGFSAVMTKLMEITEQDNPGVKARVLKSST